MEDAGCLDLGSNLGIPGILRLSTLFHSDTFSDARLISH